MEHSEREGGEVRKRRELPLAVLQLVYERLLFFLKENRRFTEGGLNRQTVALALKTNERSLCLAIQKFSEEKTLAKMIGRMRIRYGAELLVRHKEYKVEAIASECGFKSRRSFYRVFFKYYQCTPIAFRDRAFLASGKKKDRLSNKTLNVLKKDSGMNWKLKESVLLQEIGDVKVLIALNLELVDYSQVISLNDVAAYIAERVSERACSDEYLAACVCEEYEIDKEAALQDIRELKVRLNSLGVIDECE